MIVINYFYESLRCVATLHYVTFLTSTVLILVTIFNNCIFVYNVLHSRFVKEQSRIATRSKNRIVISVTIIILQLKISAPVENFLYTLFHSKNGTTNETAQTFKKAKAESSNIHKRVICNYAAQ